MVLPVTQFFSKKIPSDSYYSRPMFTSIPTSFGGSASISTLHVSYKNFWNQFKRSPELVATLSIPITDIMGDRPNWFDNKGNELSEGERRKAKTFWRDNRGKETIKAMLFDGFLTGDGYLWKGSPTGKEIKEAVEKAVQILGHKMSALQTKELSSKIAQDEDIKKPKKFDYVASSTIEIQHDEFEIFGYKQRSQGKEALFDVEDIIHYRYMTLNGMVQGFSPVESLLSEITLLWLVKGNMLSFMRNGGSPDKVFILPKEIAKSKNHEYLVDTLRKYKKIENRHGNLVLTGELDIKDLQGNPKDLEYKDLALYITSNIAFAYGIPVTRIPYLIGASSNKGDSGGLSETGYWNKISEIQDSIEDLLNSQLFEAFGWNISFPRKYKQDEVREAQTNSMNADTVTKYQEILRDGDVKLTKKKVLSLLHMCNEDIREMTEEEKNPPISTGLDGQNQLPDKQTGPEPDAQRRANTKRNVANQKGSGAAVTQP